jgi:8-oxoguanine deaminase
VGIAHCSASNDCSNIIQKVHQSLLQQRLLCEAETIAAEKVLGWATKGSANVLHSNNIGELSPGKQADIAFFTLSELPFSGAGDAITGLVTYGAHQVDKLIVVGKWVIEDKHHRQVMASELFSLHSHLAKHSIA